MAREPKPEMAEVMAPPDNPSESLDRIANTLTRIENIMFVGLSETDRKAVMKLNGEM